MGVDPSCRSTGYAIVEQLAGNRLAAVEFGVIPIKRNVPLPEALYAIHSKIISKIEEFAPDLLVIEAVFYAQNVKSAIALGAVRGVVLLAAQQTETPVAEYSATQIKVAVAGYGKADKEAVQKMVQVALNLKEIPSPNDASDALAAAICHLNSARLKERIDASIGSNR
ncbi:crossover junction endodeoxyribonuclease RuvC [bacterium]|nr:crossover junction endodeoxyribonuclease RuvC [bacterium]